MSDAPAHTEFFGDSERTFRLTPPMILELERKTGVGIGVLCQRLFAGAFSYSDLTETIRVALMGGGTSPAEADALVKAYAVDRPLSEVFPLAVGIFETLWFGSAKATK